MGIIITVNSQKGGCGRTTTVQSLAVGLSMMGRKCLVVDLDPQGNLSAVSEVEEYDNTVYGFMKGECRFDEVCKFSRYYDIIPSEFKLNNINQETSIENNEYMLKNVLEPIKDRYDYIIIDTPSGHGILNVNSLVASDYVILPAEQSFYSMYGLEQLNEVIMGIQENYNSRLKIMGLLIVKYNERTAIDRFLIGLIDRFVNEYGIKLFTSYIHENSKISFVQGLQKNIIEFFPRDRTSKEYQKFSEMVDNECSIEVKKNIV